MKSYLSLVFEYAKVHKKKNRLLITCIAISVMLVTAIFGLADMALKSQINETISKYGKWHMQLSDISDLEALSIEKRPDVFASSFIGTATKTTYQDKLLVIQSCSEKMAHEMNLKVTQGRYPVTETEALLDRLGLEAFGLAIGDTITVPFNNGQTKTYQITGTYSDFSSLKSSDAHGLMLTEKALRFLPKEDYKETYYIQLTPKTDIHLVIDEMRNQYHLKEEQISINRLLLTLIGQSKENNMQQLYLMAGVLSLLVLLAGIFMIASSFNMTILERTQFFGMLRCLGATKKQVKRYVRLEGILYCMQGIPIGLLIGCIIQWIAIWIINSLESPYLPQMSLFQVSFPALLVGIIVGLLVVMIASSSPAKHASSVSPQAAITGQMRSLQLPSFKKAFSKQIFKVDTSMGIYHALSNKKNLFLIAGSFAMSIILFLCFTVFFHFMGHALKPIKPYAPDLTIVNVEETASISHTLKEEIKTIKGIDKVYGRMGEFEITSYDKNSSNKATLISYDAPQFKWADKLLIDGTIDDVQHGNGLIVKYQQAQAYNWQVGDTIKLKINDTTTELVISAIVSEIPIDSADGEWILVCSEDTFTELTNESQYRVLDMQVKEDVSNQIRKLLSSDFKLLDMQQENKEIRASYLTMSMFIYGFLGIIALIAVINIINTIDGSISSRINHYGIMRAVGMSGKQLRKVVWAEAITYAVVGSFLGSFLGLGLHNIVFKALVTNLWGTVWEPPILIICILSIASILITLLAIVIPTHKIKKMNIIEITKLITL